MTKTCRLCSTPILSITPTVSSSVGEVFHESCFAARKCPVCSNGLGNEAIVQAGNNEFHASCFRCTSCGCQLSSYAFKEHKPYCSSCIDAHKVHSPTPAHFCGGCEKEIVRGAGKVLNFGGRFFHLDCFLCSGCRSPLTTSVIEVNGVYYCSSCVEKLKEQKLELLQREEEKRREAEEQERRKHIPNCCSCQLPLEGKVVAVLGKHWHSECFVCEYCRKQLSPHDEIAEVKDRPHCMTCGEFLSPQTKK